MVESQPGATQASGANSPGPNPFIGRQRELGQLKAALADAQSGQGLGQGRPQRPQLLAPAHKPGG